MEQGSEWDGTIPSHPIPSHPIPSHGTTFFLKCPMGWDGTKLESHGMGWDEFSIPWDFHLFFLWENTSSFVVKYGFNNFIGTISYTIHYPFIVGPFVDTNDCVYHLRLIQLFWKSFQYLYGDLNSKSKNKFCRMCAPQDCLNPSIFLYHNWWWYR